MQYDSLVYLESFPDFSFGNTEGLNRCSEADWKLWVDKSFYLEEIEENEREIWTVNSSLQELVPNLRMDVDHLEQGARAGLPGADDDGSRQPSARVREVEAVGAGARAHHRARRGVAQSVQQHGDDQQQQRHGGDQQPAAAAGRRLRPRHCWPASEPAAQPANLRSHTLLRWTLAETASQTCKPGMVLTLRTIKYRTWCPIM